MTINNKYHLGDKVYFINTENKAMCDEVKAIYIYVYKDYTSVRKRMLSSQKAT